MATIYLTADDSVFLTDSLIKEISVSLPTQHYYYWNPDTQEWEVVDDIYAVWRSMNYAF